MRSLTTKELQHALAIEPGDEALDHDNITSVKDMISACAGLVITETEISSEKEIEVVRLVHYTTREYFERTWER